MPLYRAINYADWHDVDEDMMIIPVQGGNWNTWGRSAATGVMCRNMTEYSTNTWDSVASSNTKNSQIIRIFIMSTKI